MKIPASILALLLAPFSIAFQDEYDNLKSYSGPDYPDFYSAFSRPTRSDAFLRFGRNYISEEETNDIPTFLENFVRPTRSEGEGLAKNNELFVRFGRNKDDIFSRPTRSDAFLRFGRNYISEEETNDIPTFLENFVRPTRSEGEGLAKNNELFVRFGRNKDDIFSRLRIAPTRMYPLDQVRSTRQNSEYLRFGRSIQNEEQKNTPKTRTKRDVVIPESLKRKDNFLRFGRNSNFMRFGRNGNHIDFQHYFPKSGQNGINLARLLRKIEYERYLKNHDIQ